MQKLAVLFLQIIENLSLLMLIFLYVYYQSTGRAQIFSPAYFPRGEIQYKNSLFSQITQIALFNHDRGFVK